MAAGVVRSARCRSRTGTRPGRRRSTPQPSSESLRSRNLRWSAMATRSDPIFAFVLGTGRCGSSLIHEVIARHPDLGFVSNVDDRLWPLRLKGRRNNELYRRVPEALTRKGRIRFAPSEGYRMLEHEVSPIVCAPARDLVARDASPWLARRFRAFFEERARAQRKPVFSHKFTGWPRARLIDAVLPDARFIHVIR